MSKRKEYCGRLVSKPFKDKENACSSQNAKCIEHKDDVEKKKGLSAGSQNLRSDVECKSSISKFAIERKSQFQVYSDDNSENERSRSLIRKGAYRRKIREIKNGDQKLPIHTEFKKEKPICSLNVVSYRARSLSNQNRVSSQYGDNKLSVKSARRTCSESRNSYKQNTLYPPLLSITPKSEFLSNDVKKRTLHSIEKWKNKMRKFYIDNRPKNSSIINFAVSKVDEARAKINPSNTYNFHCLPKISRCELNLVRSDTPTSEIARNGRADTNEDINNKPDLQDLASGIAKPYISSEFAMISQIIGCSNTQADTGVRSCTRDNDRQSKEKQNSDCVTSSNSPPIRPLASEKMHYEQDKVTSQFSTKKEDFEHFDQTLYESDYLTEIPDTEREREENAPKLSASFLRGNKINPQQRKLIMKYLIQLGMHYNYESFIIYQTVKLFDIVVDRIVVSTEEIQLIALACLWIILKRELLNCKVPTATDILNLAENVYKDQKERLLICEKEILSTLKFNVRFADPYSLLMYYVSSLRETTQYISRYNIMRIYFCGSYLIDVSMFDESLCVISIFVLTITAFEMSLDFVLASNSNIDQTWRQSLRQRTLAIWEEKQMSLIKQIMIKLVLESVKPDSRIVYRKYRRSKRGKISEFLLESVKKATGHMHNIE